MHRAIVWGGQIPRTPDILNAETEALIGHNYAVQDVLQSATNPTSVNNISLVSGFTPSYTGGMTVNFAAGRLYTMSVVDATILGDTSGPIVGRAADSRASYQQAQYDAGSLTFAAAPTTAGQSRIDLVQISMSVVDDQGVLLQFYSGTPNQPLEGSGGSGVNSNTRRSIYAVPVIKTGTPASSPTAPTPDSGYVPLFYVTVAYGQTSIASLNLTLASNSPFLAGLTSQHHLGIPGSAPKINLATEVEGVFSTGVGFPASTTISASGNIAAGVEPYLPTNGDFWYDGSSLGMQLANYPRQFATRGDTQLFSGVNTFGEQALFRPVQPPGTFARASIAYDSYSGFAGSGAPRYSMVGGKIGVRVEEATTNLLTANQSSIETDTTGFTADAGVTMTRDTTVYWEGTASLKLVCDGTAIQGATTSGPTTGIAASTKYTVSAWVEGSGTVYLITNEYQASSAYIGSTPGTPIVLSNTPQRLELTGVTSPATAQMSLSVRTDSPQAVTFWVDGLQMEQMAYATSWQSGGTPRVAETLAIPTAGVLNPAQGTIILEAYASGDVLNPSPSKQYYLFTHTTNPASGFNLIGIERNPSGFIYAELGNTTTTNAGWSPSTWTAGIHTLAIRWDSSELSLWVDGVKRAATANPPIPGALATDCYIGSASDGTVSWDDVVFGVRISTSVLSDAELAAITPTTGLPAYITGQTYGCDYTWTLTPNENTASINVGVGSDPLSPISGDVWINGAVKARVGGVSQTLAALNAPQAFTQPQTFNGNMAVGPGDETITIGPNVSWGKSLVLGGSTISDSTNAAIHTSNGNLHLDATGVSATYLNFYQGSGGTVFGNGAIGQVGFVDSLGNATFDGNVSAGLPGVAGNPTVSTRSVGTRFVVDPVVDGTHVDYAIGYSAGSMWLSVPSNSPAFSWDWFGGTTQVASLDGIGNATFNGALKVGPAPSAITNIATYAPSLTPTVLSSASVSEQVFTVAGLATNDKVTVNGPGGAQIVNARVSAANTIAITFDNPTAISYTPPAGVYNVVAIRS